MIAGGRGVGDRLADLLHSMCASVARQIRSDETTFARNHVAGGTSRFRKEDRLPALGIPGQLDGLLCSLQGSQISYDCFDVGTLQKVKGRHSSSMNTILNNEEESSNGKLCQLC